MVETAKLNTRTKQALQKPARKTIDLIEDKVSISNEPISRRSKSVFKSPLAAGQEPAKKFG